MNIAKSATGSALLYIIVLSSLLSAGPYSPLLVSATKGDFATVSPGKRSLFLDPKNTTTVELVYPRGAVFQETRGDLLFAITLNATRRSIAIYVPEEFRLSGGTTAIWTSITNDYRLISVTVLDERDTIAPRWWRVLVSSRAPIQNGTQHFIRMFNVTAPSIIGRYFFKIFTDGTSIEFQNFPTLVVTGDPDPAHIAGTVRHGLPDRELYGKPLRIPVGGGGVVHAEGVSNDGRRIVGQAFFSAAMDGSYFLPGLPPGTYELWAAAAGFAPTKHPYTIRLTKSQSLFVDIFVNRSPQIAVTLFSKCDFGLHPWGSVATRSGVGFGGALAYVGTGPFPGKDLIYAFRGGGSNDLLAYDSNSNTWESKAPAPGPVSDGGSLAFDPSTNYLYALQGGRSKSFWRYDIVNDVWSSNLQPTPAEVSAGGGIVFHQSFVYALGGDGTTNFWRYSPTTQFWEILAPTPSPVSAGGPITADVDTGRVYAFRGGGTSDFWQFSPDSGTWQTDPPADPVPPSVPVPLVAVAGAALTLKAGGRFFAIFGGASDFARYDIAGNAWGALSALPAPAVGAGGALAFDASKNLIFALHGGGSLSFSRYDISANSWLSVRSLPTEVPRRLVTEIFDSSLVSKELFVNVLDPSLNSYKLVLLGNITLDGHIPQDNAGDVAGIEPGVYYLKFYIFGYYQLQDLRVTVDGFGTVKHVPFDMYRGGRLLVTLHFKRFSHVLAVTNVTSDSIVDVAVYDRFGELTGRNSTTIRVGFGSVTVRVDGIFGGRRDFGIRPGTFSVVADVFPKRTFIQLEEQKTTFTAACNATNSISFDLVRSGALNVTVRSVDAQRPQRLVNWERPFRSIAFQVRDLSGAIVVEREFSSQKRGAATANVQIEGLLSGSYIIVVQTSGYVQKEIRPATVLLGTVGDLSVDMVAGANVTVTVSLRKEKIFSSIDTYSFSDKVPFRAELYDSNRVFVGATIGSVSRNSTSFGFTIIGFDSYFGNPSSRWVNYYDTTDAARQSDGGIGSGAYTVLVFLPGFNQPNIIRVELSIRQTAGVILSLHRLSHLTGNVLGFDRFRQLNELSWATVNADGALGLVYTSSLDGFYEMWVLPGPYIIFVSIPSYRTELTTIHAGDGSDTSIDFYLSPLSYS